MADIIRFWKDEAYRRNLSDADRVGLPENPAGCIGLSDADLQLVAGGSTEHLLTIGCCSGLTSDPGLCSLACDDTTGYGCCVASATPMGCCG